MSDLPVLQLGVIEDSSGVVVDDHDGDHDHGCHSSGLNHLLCLLLHVAQYASCARRAC